ncbi:hypothetical protein GUJ93_ZPchr0109g40562 [Zizania palustris]|uniref:Pentatricopeptide repeat-containing protein n=1 Tax=Zizania palustris TaxID=103762 RepID=A0A8J5V016_ZIZPA|nr:hypothetical protein GUJ93_ZPchr0109g40562 [Zizania palustris]
MDGHPSRPDYHHRGHVPRRLSSIFASSRSSAFSTASTSAPASQLRPPPAYAVFKQRLLSGTLGPDDARHLFDEVLRGCDLANAPNALLSALARAPPSAACSDGPGLAVELFKRMDRCASPQAAPTVYTYNILIDCYRRAHRPDLGLATFGRLLRSGLGLNVVAYNTVIDGFFKKGKVDKAYDLFREMEKHGISPNVVTYSLTIHGLCKSNAMDKAFDLFCEMKKQGISPDVVTYNSTIDGLCKSKAMDKAYDLFCEMEKQGISPDVVTYTSTIDGFCKSKAMDKAEKVLQQMLDAGVQPDNMIQQHDQWVFHFGNVEGVSRIKEAKDIFDSMVLNGPKPDVTSYTVLLHGIGRLGDALEKFSHMVDAGVTPDRTLLKKSEVIEAGNYLSKIDENNFAVEASTASLLLSLFSMEGSSLLHLASEKSDVDPFVVVVISELLFAWSQNE